MSFLKSIKTILWTMGIFCFLVFRSVGYGQNNQLTKVGLYNIYTIMNILGQSKIHLPELEIFSRMSQFRHFEEENKAFFQYPDIQTNDLLTKVNYKLTRANMDWYIEQIDAFSIEQAKLSRVKNLLVDAVVGTMTDFGYGIVLKKPEHFPLGILYFKGLEFNEQVVDTIEDILVKSPEEALLEEEIVE